MDKFVSVLNVFLSFLYVIKLRNKGVSFNLVKEVITLHKKKFENIDRQTILFFFTHRNKSLYVLTDNKLLIGYALYVAKSKKEIHLKNIAIADEYLNKGYAKNLLEDSLLELRRNFKIISLNVHCQNDKAIRLYHLNGFVEVLKKDENILMHLIT